MDHTMASDFLYGPGSIFFPGYADIENPVFFRETTQMLLGLGGEGRTGDASGTVDWILHEELFYIVV
jgi:hypothetical protein